jgi:hypothetical protein
MYCVSIQSGDYRDVIFPLVATEKFSTLPQVKKYLKQRKGKVSGEYAMIYEEDASTLIDIIKE